MIGDSVLTLTGDPFLEGVMETIGVGPTLWVGVVRVFEVDTVNPRGRGRIGGVRESLLRVLLGLEPPWGFDSLILDS